MTLPGRDDDSPDQRNLEETKDSSVFRENFKDNKHYAEIEKIKNFGKAS